MKNLQILAEPPREPACLSDFVFDRLIAGELAHSAAGDQHRAHIASCRPCAARFARLTQQASEFRRHAASHAPAARPRRARPLAYRVLPLLLGAAAVLVLLIRYPQPDALRRKGGLALEVFVKHRSSAVEQLLPGATVAPGDALGFRVSTPQEGYLALISLDGTGALTSYLPPARELLPLPAGERQLIDGGVELDQVLGPEQLLVLLCPRRLEVAQVLSKVGPALRAGSPELTRRELDRAGLLCSYTTFSFKKVPRP